MIKRVKLFPQPVKHTHRDTINILLDPSSRCALVSYGLIFFPLRLMALLRALAIYSCFEKGCLTNEEKRTRQCRQWIWVIRILGFHDWSSRCLKPVEGNSTNPCIHNFSFLLAGHREPQSNNAKLLVAYAFTLQAPVVRKVDNAIHRINHYPVDSVVCFVNTYPLDCDLSGG